MRIFKIHVLSEIVFKTVFFVVLLGAFFFASVHTVSANAINCDSTGLVISPSSIKYGETGTINVTAQIDLTEFAYILQPIDTHQFKIAAVNNSVGTQDATYSVQGHKAVISATFDKSHFRQLITYRLFLTNPTVTAISNVGLICDNTLTVVPSQTVGTYSSCSASQVANGFFTCNYTYQGVDGSWYPGLDAQSCETAFSICTGSDKNKFSSIMPPGPPMNVACIPCVTPPAVKNYGDTCVDGDNCGAYVCRDSAVQAGKKRCLQVINTGNANSDCISQENECNTSLKLICQVHDPVMSGDVANQGSCQVKECTTDDDCRNDPQFSKLSTCVDGGLNIGKFCKNPDPQAPGAHPWELCNQIKQNDPAYLQCTGCSGTQAAPQDRVYTAIGCIPSNPKSIVQNILQVGLSLAGGVALLMIIASGFIITISSGDQNQIKTAREMLTGAVIGLIFIIMSVTILQFIGVTILHIPGFGGN